MDMVSESPIGLDFELLFPTSVKIELIHKLVASGLLVVEVTSFVSPKLVPLFQLLESESESIITSERASTPKFSFKFSKRSLREFAVDVFSLGTKEEKP
ncbi:hypothetical protein GUJ93_ZPchr0011g28188 [Zizania palustris]|uniref:Hydroxymethylglutaryl-CoA lyase n=1 Tax=Zizania palustris TaxID=103762 RepID=A0A8J5WMI8_ZIZPA|nr:hypothetical protein GUJ93_ZPchr0011g28188 [Zizania palustris]